MTTKEVAKHTPGPWIIAGREAFDNAIRISTTQENKMKRTAIGLVYPKPHYDDTQEADARLIAAAPELLGVLKGIMALPGINENHPWAMGARAAIKRAEGGK